MPHLGPTTRTELIRCLRQLVFVGRSREANTNSWSKSICGSVFQIPIEATSGNIFCELFSERLGISVAEWENL